MAVGGVEREAEVTCERVRAAEGKDADCRRGMMCESLNDLVQCAVAAAGEDELRAVADCIGSLRAGGSGAVGCDDLGLDAVADEQRSRHARVQRGVSGRRVRRSD